MTTSQALPNSAVASAIPVSSSLVANSLAVNTTDGTLYTKRLDNTIVRIEGDRGNGALASASTINLGSLMAAVIDVTGNNTINTITLQAGQTRTVRFTGVLSLVNSVSLVLPGGSNVTTAAGDYATFRGYASGITRCTNYSFINNPFSVTSTDASIIGAFGCNGKSPQSSYTVSAASTDLASVITLCNQLRAALIANGISV